MKIVGQTFTNRVKIGDAGGAVHFEDCIFDDGIEIRDTDGCSLINCITRVPCHFTNVRGLVIEGDRFIGTGVDA